MTPDLLAVFSAAAAAAGADVLRAEDAGRAMAAAARLLEKENIRTLGISRPLRRAAEAAGLAAGIPEGPAGVAEAGAALVRGDFGAAETGTVICLDSDDEERLLWTLPRLCVCLLESRAIVPDLLSVARAVSEHLARRSSPAPRVSFITGPSRTADIECQLEIGVQGPARFVVILVDGGGV
ncbi:MAG: LUD domain-containing protein [Acidobacteriota bacterium]